MTRLGALVATIGILGGISAGIAAAAIVALFRCKSEPGCA